MPRAFGSRRRQGRRVWYGSGAADSRRQERAGRVQDESGRYDVGTIGFGGSVDLADIAPQIKNGAAARAARLPQAVHGARILSTSRVALVSAAPVRSFGTRIHFPLHERPRASIVILAWRQLAPLMACLQALNDCLNDRIPYEVIIVLAGTAREVEDAVRSTVSGATLMNAAVNLGFGGGCNLGVTAARGEYVVLLNDDAVVEPGDGWLEWLVHTADAHPAAGAVGSCVLFPDGSVQEAGSVIWRDGSTMPVGRGSRGNLVTWHFVTQVEGRKSRSSTPPAGIVVPTPTQAANKVVTRSAMSVRGCLFGSLSRLAVPYNSGQKLLAQEVTSAFTRG